jgi:1-acyl-sn-glycerol-3-phosphate acyltransferase
VGAAIERFRERSQWVLAVSPEGTRGRVAEWRTGFHRIAAGAGVPICPVAFDFSRRAIVIFELFTPSEDVSADLTRLRRLYRPEMALHPELFVAEPATPHS